MTGVDRERHARAASDAPICLRPARPDEADALTALLVASKASHGYDAEFMRRHADVLAITTEEVMRDRVVVATREDRVLGFSRVSAADEPGTLWLDDLFIHPEAQGQGVGRLLWEDVCAHARSVGARRVMFDADPNAVGFYERLGALVVGQIGSTVIPGRRIPRMRHDVTGDECWTVPGSSGETDR